MKPCLKKIISIFCAILLPLLGTASADNALNVVFMGDSITQICGVPPICAKELQKHGSKVYFSNQGHCGHTTVDFLPNGQDMTESETAAKKLMSEHPGKLIFSIMLGTNDSANSGPTGAPVSNTDYHANLKKTIDQLLADFPDSKIFIHSPIWYSPNTHNGSDYEGAPAADRVKSYFTEIESLVTEYQTSNPNHVFQGDTLAYKYFQTHFKTELNAENGKSGVFYLHPNVAGGASLAKFWEKAIYKGLEQQH